MREISAKAQKILRILRVIQVVIAFLLLLPIVAAMATVWYPWLVPYVLILFSVYLVVPLIGVFILVGMPFKAKSIIRLVQKGYPQNVKEFAIRAAARKLHEQSIETEELLVDTAINESKKALKKYRARAERLREQLDAMDEEEDEDPQPHGGSL